eukprot:TRINITY_DN3732_c1_g1_i1.p2 TRINITY_DN3732_c1_g1~~TRINITY_DN3732_c1_g1_i1.p2  ORF type:complete len:104 (+),score=41.72 TRINITY_DN3732_c1_g1_i1:299-610(+)
MAAAFIGAFMAFMVLAFMTILEGFLCFITRRFMAFIGASSCCAAFFIARFMAFIAPAFIALAFIAFMAVFIDFFMAAAIVYQAPTGGDPAMSDVKDVVLSQTA